MKFTTRYLFIFTFQFKREFKENCLASTSLYIAQIQKANSNILTLTLMLVKTFHLEGTLWTQWKCLNCLRTGIRCSKIWPWDDRLFIESVFSTCNLSQDKYNIGLNQGYMDMGLSHSRDILIFWEIIAWSFQFRNISKLFSVHTHHLSSVINKGGARKVC